MQHVIHLTRLCFIALLFNLASSALADDAKITPNDAPIALQELRTFTEIFERIRTAYVEEVDDKTLFEYAINGMLSSLDPHSAYLKDDDFVDLKENTTGKFGGLGIEVSMEDGWLLVVTPIDDTPAQQAGILAGDLIVSINGETVMGLSLSEAIEKMRGETGTKIKIEVRRKNEKELLNFTLTRAEIKVASVRSEMLDNRIGYIRITQFQDSTGEDLSAILNQWQENDTLQGIILDLRNNPGGVLDAAVEVADMFIDSGLIVYTEGRTAASKMEFSATENTPAGNTPTVVLINSGSASASEIVAGALQDQKRAVILGTQSFGKGSVQSVLPLSETSAVKLTTARYFTPSGRSIQAQGIKPDIWVEQSEVTAFKQRTFKESNLPGHLRNNSTTSKTESTEEQQQSESTLLQKDFQLYEAYTLLKGVSIFTQAKDQ
ncbi:MAG: S41 family peptidase [Venatoribacter sp.]